MTCHCRMRTRAVPQPINPPNAQREQVQLGWSEKRGEQSERLKEVERGRKREVERSRGRERKKHASTHAHASTPLHTRPDDVVSHLARVESVRAARVARCGVWPHVVVQHGDLIHKASRVDSVWQSPARVDGPESNICHCLRVMVKCMCVRVRVRVCACMHASAPR